MSQYPGQDPNQPSQYGGYNPPQPQPTDPYSGQQYGGQQPYGQNPYGQQQQYSQNPYGAPAGAPSPLGASSLGLDPKVSAGLSYLFGVIGGIVFFLLEKQNRFVRFHAMQSIIFSGGLWVLAIVLGVIGNHIPFPIDLAFSCISSLLWLGFAVGWIVLMINAFQGKYFKLPVIGNYAEQYANQGMPPM